MEGNNNNDRKIIVKCARAQCKSNQVVLNGFVDGHSAKNIQTFVKLFDFDFNTINILIHLIMQRIFVSFLFRPGKNSESLKWFCSCFNYFFPSICLFVCAQGQRCADTHVWNKIDWKRTQMRGKKIQFRDLQICMQFEVVIIASQMKSKLCQKPIFFALSARPICMQTLFSTPSTHLNRATIVGSSALHRKWYFLVSIANEKRRWKKNHRDDLFFN